MADLVFLALTVGFFALMVLLVRACDHIIGPDPTSLVDRVGDPVDDEAGTAVGPAAEVRS